MGRDEQLHLMLTGVVDRQRRQIGMITSLLIVVSAIILTLIVYTLTMERLTSIALLKLIGAPDRVILGMVLRQALFIGSAGHAIAYVLGRFLFPLFPRRVLITEPDLQQLALIVVGMCVLGSLLGIWRAVRVSPNEVLS